MAFRCNLVAPLPVVLDAAEIGINIRGFTRNIRPRGLGCRAGDASQAVDML
jgi:hypothetical protein